MGGAPDGNAILIPKENAELAMDAASCIGCGACVAACPNASAMLFVGAKVSQLALLPQGQPERHDRVRNMVAQMDAERFGTCTNHGECESGLSEGHPHGVHRAHERGLPPRGSDGGPARRCGRRGRRRLGRERRPARAGGGAATAMKQFFRRALSALAPAMIFPFALASALAQGATVGAPGGGEKPGPRLQIYGFAMLDLIYDFDQVDPNWFDMVRPSKLPAFPNQFGENGNFWASVRPSRLGVRSWLPTGLGEVRAEFEFDLLGVGPDAGQTTFHIRQAWGELGPILAGQTWSVFMDPDIFPNYLEFWGPNGMVFYRNVQLRWTPIRGEDRLAFALERPGATGDSGEFADRVELKDIHDHFPYPDFTAQYRHEGEWGHVQLSGIVRYIGWTDAHEDAFDLSGHKIGWGVNFASVWKPGKRSTFRLEASYGEGIATYMRDAPTDVAAAHNEADPRRPVVGKALPIFGMVAFYEFQWSDTFRSAFGYSRLDVDNSDGQLPNAFKSGQYATADLLFYPVKDVLTGLELQWGHRRNFADGLDVDDVRIQFSAKYSFSFQLGGGK